MEKKLDKVQSILFSKNENILKSTEMRYMHFLRALKKKLDEGAKCCLFSQVRDISFISDVYENIRFIYI